MWLLIAIFKIKFLLVVSTLISIQKDHGLYRSDLLESFNVMYGLKVNEEYLNPEGICSGYCDNFNTIHIQKENVHNVTPALSTSNCYGTIHHCWYEEQTEARKQAWWDTFTWPLIPFQFEIDYTTFSYGSKIDKLKHTGNICGCLCERTFDPNFDTPRGKLLDSICYDQVLVDRGYVATGARFKRHNKTIHIELQQGKLIGGEIDPATVEWKPSQNCRHSKRVISKFKGANYIITQIVLEDMILLEDAVVTGVKFGKALYGRYINERGVYICGMGGPLTHKFDVMESIFENAAHTYEALDDYADLTLLHGYWNLPPTMYKIGKDVLQSESCKHRVFITGSSYKDNNMRHVIPYINVQEVITDPPEPIHGIGWYYHSHPKYEGYIGLRIFKKDTSQYLEQDRYFYNITGK